MEVKRGVARAVCARSPQYGIVPPSNSRFNVSTTHDADNIDSTAQGNFSMSEFHGYTLSMTSHCSHENPGVKRSPINLNPSDTSIPKLPDSYVIQPSPQSSLLKRMSLPQNSMKHAMELTMQWTEILNPDQTCVLGADQPLYAIIKLIQWQFPVILGEYKLVVIMGALHIENKMHLMIGKLQHDTGWATILSQVEVLTSGRAQSTLDEHHIKRTRYAHQVSLVALYMLKQSAYVLEVLQ